MKITETEVVGGREHFFNIQMGTEFECFPSVKMKKKLTRKCLSTILLSFFLLDIRSFALDIRIFKLARVSLGYSRLQSLLRSTHINKIELFVKIVKGFQPLTSSSIVDV